MDFQPSAEQDLVGKTARDFARDVLRPRAAARDRDETFPEDELRALGGLGLLGVTVPEALGGSGLGPLELAEALVAIAEADAAVAVTMAVTNMVAEVLARYATPLVQAQFLPALCRGDLLAGAFALSEPGAGSDPAAMRTTYQPLASGFVISGNKLWTTSGDRAGVLAVVARKASDDPSGRPVHSAFAVARGTPGLEPGRHERKMGQRGSSTVALSLDGVKVADMHLLGREGDGLRIALAALDGGRINVGAMAVGVARAALAHALTYARTRVQFGRPIGDFAGIQAALADSATHIDAAWLMVQRAAWRKQHGRPLGRAAAAAKLFASEMAIKVCDSALQIHGGYGYSREFPVERFFRDARVMTIYEGTSQIQKLVIARALIKELAMGDLDVQV